MNNTTVHIINHTHWDREWFLTSIYTSEWIPGLIDRLEEIVAENPSFRYLLDGQTLIIEDLLELQPDYEDKVRKLVSGGNLIIGPYYLQPDWQLTSGESLMRNLQYGLEITENFGGKIDVGWMVDTFGHISQSPQMHQKYGIGAVYVWRGMPKLEPYFEWHGSGGHTVFGIDLFGGYRNLYGVTHAPTIAEVRVQKETERLAPYYPTADVPLFDGYDLEDNPEDPVSWLQARGKLPSHLKIRESTPISFAHDIRPQLGDLPQICGELNSGKYGATFPGTFSSRAYLKIFGHACEHLLYQVVEPLSGMAWLKGAEWEGERFKQWTKTILQNAVHDAICGVSIDQVHEKMEFSYRQIFSEMMAEVERQLPVVLGGFVSGRYAVSTSAVPTEKWVKLDNELLHIKTEGVGVFPIAATSSYEPTDQSTIKFSWENDHYSAELDVDGVLVIDGVRFGELQISADRGDTYSDETEELLGTIKPAGTMRLEAHSEQMAVCAFDSKFELEDGYVTAKVSYTFDPSPVVGVTVELESRGKNFHVELKLESGGQGEIFAGMPFDRVKRPSVDRDLLPRHLDSDLKDIMMGQRELNRMRTFPMHSFVGLVDGKKSAVVFSKGIRSYRSWENGELAISLRRSVEWVTEADLTNRIGDAGPFFYVPDARCERKITHSIGLYVGDVHPEDDRFNKLEASFQHTPLIADVEGSGEQTHWQVAQSDQPVSAIWPENDQLVGRVWHATGAEKGLISETAITEEERERVDEFGHVSCHLLNHPLVPIGDNKGLPDRNVLAELKNKVEQLTRKIEDARLRFEKASGDEKLKVEHELYIYDRERHEFLLSICLNEKKLEQLGRLDADYLYQLDPDVTDLGYRLNKLRIKRRIFDYVATVI